MATAGFKRFRPTVRIVCVKNFDDTYEEYGDKQGVRTRVFLNRCSMTTKEGVRSLDLRHAEKLLAAKQVEYADKAEAVVSASIANTEGGGK